MTIFFRQIRYKLLGGFLVRPLIFAIALGVAGALLSHLEEWVPPMNAWIPTILFPSRSDPDMARLIFSTIASAMMTVVSIVFAILLMTLTLASMQFSPRIITNFIEDRVTQYTLGIFLGTFGYCIAAIPAVRSSPPPFVPILTVTGAMLLAFICSCCLLFFINHISEAISASHIVDRLASQTLRMIDELMPPDLGQIRAKLPANPNTYLNQTPILSNRSGYIRFIDTKQLLSFAQLHQTDIQVVRRVGHYVPMGIPLFVLSSDREITKAIRNDFRSAFDFGPTRTLQQDVEFGILKIVDIALKAISPAVNDPSTAITCVDHLSAILIHFASRHPPDDVLTDTDGKVFVSIPWLDFERLVDSAFEQIRMYSRTDVAVSLRIFRALADIAHTVPKLATRKLLADRGRRILAGCAKSLEENEIVEMRRRMSVLETLAGN
jgi:uncharacterized membrane protein